MKYISIIALFVSALIHLLPVSGVAGAAALRRLYAIEVVDANTSILLRHRALLFGLLGAVMLVAIGVPSIRVPVMAAALFSAASFIVLAMWVGGYNAALSRVIAADAVVSALLAMGLVTEVLLS